MVSLPFYIIDVFATKRFSGNQVAVVKVNGNITDKEMQRLAHEIYSSETAYILSDKKENGGYDVRFFTREQEVPYSGHAALGTAFTINQIFSAEPQKQIILNLKSGPSPITIEYNQKIIITLWTELSSPKFGQIYEPVLLSKILGIEPEDIDRTAPIEEVSTGIPFIIVPLKNLRVMKEIEINKERYYWLVKKSQAKAILVYCSESNPSENQYNVRVFADYYGIPEDPATGAGNGGLAAYLLKNKYLDKDEINIRVEQGTEIGRPSLIYAKAKKDGREFKISVGGNGIMVAKGEFI